MSADLARHPQLLALLDAARLSPYDDTPRLVLSDWLDEHGAHDRADFIRLQLRLAPGGPPLDSQQRSQLLEQGRRLQARHGGGWLGPFWNWRRWPPCWHRGLLSVQFSGRYAPADCDGGW